MQHSLLDIRPRNQNLNLLSSASSAVLAAILETVGDLAVKFDALTTPIQGPFVVASARQCSYNTGNPPNSAGRPGKVG
jgi:hypothetical protein